MGQSPVIQFGPVREFMSAAVPAVDRQFSRPKAEPALDAMHQPSHRQLIETLDPPSESAGLSGMVDLIMIPTSRPFAKTRPAIELALELAYASGAALTLICSRKARIQDFPDELLEKWPVPTALIPIPTDLRSSELLPRFGTSSHAFAIDAWTWPRDVADKRNIGLLLAIALGRRHVLFLDDDVLSPPIFDLPSHLVFGERSVANAFRRIHAGQYQLVGWTMDEFPDNSALCHARRLLGLPQQSFIGGGSLALHVTDEVPFFPRVYNEDWLFLYPYLVQHQRGGKPVGSGGIIHQAKYNPFATGRARSEEMGDILAEGLLASMDPGVSRRDASHPEYWRLAIERRSDMIADLSRKLELASDRQLTVRHKAEMREALRSVVELREHASTRLGDLGLVYRDFLKKWRRDRTRWRRHVSSVQPVTAVKILQLDGARILGCTGVEDMFSQRQ